MAICETCGNDYDKTFDIIMNGERHTYDSFECAIQAHAPACMQCDTRIIGHGVESEGKVFCSAHCAKRGGVEQAVDRVEATA